MARQSDTQWGRYAGLGLEMAVGVGLGYLIGGWLDRKFGWNGNGVLIGAIVGVAVGMYLLIKQAIAMNRNGK